ncbi:MAG: ZIP family metal transporter, partial [Deinococcota bacterium]
GVMLAASYFSLLAPALEFAEASRLTSWYPLAVGFLLGVVFVKVIHDFVPHLPLGMDDDDHQPSAGGGSGDGAGDSTVNDEEATRLSLLIYSITIHNIPEGLAVGAAFAAALSETGNAATLTGAIVLTLGLALQNIPEGLAVSMPLRRSGVSVWRSFHYGQLSGIVEPIAALLGALTITLIEPLMPYALSFAAAAMIYVVISELIPEVNKQGEATLANMGLVLGFVLMMVLDVGLG